MNYEKNLVPRTKMFARRIIRLFAALSKDTAAQVLGKQVLRAGTSVGANYREASRARSKAEFVSKNWRLLEGGRRDSVLAGTVTGRRFRADKATATTC